MTIFIFEARFYMGQSSTILPWVAGSKEKKKILLILFPNSLMNRDNNLIYKTESSAYLSLNRK